MLRTVPALGSTRRTREGCAPTCPPPELAPTQSAPSPAATSVGVLPVAIGAHGQRGRLDAGDRLIVRVEGPDGLLADGDARRRLAHGNDIRDLAAFRVDRRERVSGHGTSGSPSSSPEEATTIAATEARTAAAAAAMSAGRRQAPPVGRRLLGGASARRRPCRGRERRVLREHSLLETLELRARLHPELLDQLAPEVAVDVERLLLAPRPVEGEHELRARALAKRMVPARTPAGLRSRRRAAPARARPRTGPPSRSRGAPRAVPPRRARRDRRASSSKRLAAPQCERRTQVLQRVLGSPVGAAPVGRRPPERSASRASTASSGSRSRYPPAAVSSASASTPASRRVDRRREI